MSVTIEILLEAFLDRFKGGVCTGNGAARHGAGQGIDMGNVVAVAVGVPRGVLTSARFLPGNQIARRSLLRTNWRPGTVCPVYEIPAAILQRGAGSAAAVEVVLVAA